MLPIIGITTGDINGIGPEVIIKTFSDPRMAELCTPVIFSSTRLLDFYKKTLPDFPLQYNVVKDFNSLKEGAVNVFACWDEEVSIQPGVQTETGGKYAIRSLMVAAQCLKDGQITAMVTAPIHKGNTRTADFPYTGHTPFLKDKFEAKEVVMLLFWNELRVGLVTEHVPVANVASLITKDLVLAKLRVLRDTLVRDFGIDKPRIAVLGLNPHAGDEGQIGNEEAVVIKPILEEAQAAGQTIYGPYSADAFFARRSYEKFDAVLAMYHDQGLIPFKTIAAGEGVNYTAGLSSVRTSPDHGTAYDIAGKGIADESSLREAVFSAIDFAAQRAAYAEGTANPLVRRKAEREFVRR